jgi:DNA-binding transcriptional ArsR family regulator
MSTVDEKVEKVVRTRKVADKPNKPRPGRPKGSLNKSTILADYRRKAHALKQLGDATRLHILNILSEGEQNVGQLVAQVGASQANCSHHLSLMKASGVVEADRRGKNIFYTLTETGAALVEAAKTI